MTVKRNTAYLVVDSHMGYVASRHNELKGAVKGKQKHDCDGPKDKCNYGVIIVRDVEGSSCHVGGKTYEGYRELTESENDEADQMRQEFNQYGWR